MPKSMTGYGKCMYTDDTCKIVVEIKSVNSRYLELVNKIPRSLNYFEDSIRKSISEKVKRGRVETFIQFDSYSQDTIHFMDEKMALYYKNVFDEIEKKTGIKNDMAMSSYINLPNILNKNESIDDSLQEKILSSLKNAIDSLNTMRENEGNKIAKDLKIRASLLKELTKTLEDYTKDIEKSVFEKLQKKITEMTSQLGVDADNSKIIEQAAFYADKMNVTEEIVRLYSHIEQLNEFLQEDSLEIGKKIDFLLQEMNREINTVGSKSQKSEIISLVVDIKSEIEKIREQIQNIE
ncbi:TIGR00255 family protein [[Eubacterium] yurii subsp. margaretiae ATCC 43715]|nr:TIGR00255 family protein [[Eubacterium] yurii subsp. margaretiae ATCC 43715]